MTHSATRRLDDETHLGGYRIHSWIGSGAMAEVYLAEETETGSVVALKVLPREGSDDDRLRRFEREAEAVSSLRHPNIVTIHEIGRHEDIPFIAMEYIDGWTLRELLGRGPLDLESSIEIALEIARALAAAHAAGIVHRDLKPDNVMISKQGGVKILDFGLSKPIGSPGPSSQSETTESLTLPGTILGTLEYMSPEQASGHPVEFRSDQFALGALLYEMLTGRMAFKRDTIARTLAAVIEGREEPLRSLRPEVSDELEALVSRCLSKKPWDRFRSMPWLVRKLEGMRTERRPARGGSAIARFGQILAASGLALAALWIAVI